MYPRVHPDQVFPRPVDEYADHLGTHQAEAFRLLWNFHNGNDPITAMDNAHWHLTQALKAAGTGEVKLAPKELRAELSTAARRFVLSSDASAADTVYIELFGIIASWHHELVDGNMASFVDGLYA